MPLISRPLAFCNFLFRLFQVLLDLLDGPLAFLDRLQSVLPLQGSFRSGSSSLRQLGFALPDPSLAARYRRLTCSEILRSCVEFRELRLHLRSPLAQLAG